MDIWEVPEEEAEEDRQLRYSRAKRDFKWAESLRFREGPELKGVAGTLDFVSYEEWKRHQFYSYEEWLQHMGFNPNWK